MASPGPSSINGGEGGGGLLPLATPGHEAIGGGEGGDAGSSEPRTPSGSDDSAGVQLAPAGLMSDTSSQHGQVEGDEDAMEEGSEEGVWMEEDGEVGNGEQVRRSGWRARGGGREAPKCACVWCGAGQTHSQHA